MNKYNNKIWPCMVILHNDEKTIGISLMIFSFHLIAVSVWNKILWVHVDRQLGCLHQIYHGSKEMLMAPSLSDTGNMGPVWGVLNLTNLKQNPAFWVSFELKIRTQIFINYIQHVYLASSTAALLCHPFFMLIII